MIETHKTKAEYIITIRFFCYFWRPPCNMKHELWPAAVSTPLGHEWIDGCATSQLLERCRVQPGQAPQPEMGHLGSQNRGQSWWFFRHRITCMFLENWWTWWYTIDMFMRLSSFTCFFDLLIRIIPLTIVHMQVPFGFVQSKDILKFQDWSCLFCISFWHFRVIELFPKPLKISLLIDYRRLYYMGIPGLLWIVTLTTLW